MCTLAQAVYTDHTTEAHSGCSQCPISITGREYTHTHTRTTALTPSDTQAAAPEAWERAWEKGQPG